MGELSGKDLRVFQKGKCMKKISLEGAQVTVLPGGRREFTLTNKVAKTRFFFQAPNEDEFSKFVSAIKKACAEEGKRKSKKKKKLGKASPAMRNRGTSNPIRARGASGALAPNLGESGKSKSTHSLKDGGKAKSRKSKKSGRGSNSKNISRSSSSPNVLKNRTLKNGTLGKNGTLKGDDIGKTRPSLRTSRQDKGLPAGFRPVTPKAPKRRGVKNLKDMNN